MLAVSLLVLGLTGGYWATEIDDPRDLTRMRNALLADTGNEHAVDWSPATPAPSYRFSSRRSDAFDRIAASIGGASASSDPLPKAIALAHHLTSGPGRGGAVRSDSLTTYHKIVREGRGYCADYTQVYLALSPSAGLAAREWGISFDGFGGDGHAFVEIYEPTLAQWIFIDVFNSFYVRDRSDGRPLSALEFRDVLAERREDTIDLIPIANEYYNRKGRSRTLAYYSRGIDQFYLWQANDIFDYEDHPAMRALGGLSGILAQTITILSGDYPRLLIISTASNRALINDLAHLKHVILVSIALVIVFTLTAVVSATRIAVIRFSPSPGAA